MSKQEKLIARFMVASTGFKWTELVKMLKGLGYCVIEGNGSRVKFDNDNPEQLLNLHKPHPGNELKELLCKTDQRKTERIQVNLMRVIL
jgi:predicted RNA binding protein YcfA (HicA-like mRNA interferase family)